MWTALKRTAFSELSNYYEDNGLETWVEKACELLQDSAIPRYDRTGTLLLLGSAVEIGYSSPFFGKCSSFHSDWREDRRCCVKGDTSRRFFRRSNPAGENEKKDTVMDELRDYMLELCAVLKKNKRMWVKVR